MSPLMMESLFINRHYDHHESTPLLGGQRKRLDLSSDDDDDDDDNDDRHHDNNTIHRNKRKKISWRLSYAQKRVIKCSVAYMLGSLFTFVPILNQLVGGSMAASHLAATVTVFFNPAKTIGGMVEAAGYGWLFTVCALILCMISLWVNDLLLNDGRYLLSYGLTLGVWIGVSSFVIAYFKGLMNKPSTGTGINYIISHCHHDNITHIQHASSSSSSSCSIGSCLHHYPIHTCQRGFSGSQ